MLPYHSLLFVLAQIFISIVLIVSFCHSHLPFLCCSLLFLKFSDDPFFSLRLFFSFLFLQFLCFSFGFQIGLLVMTIIESSKINEKTEPDDGNKNVILEFVVNLPKLLPPINFDGRWWIDRCGFSKIVVDVLANEVQRKDTQNHEFRRAYCDFWALFSFWEV